MNDNAVDIMAPVIWKPLSVVTYAWAVLSQFEKEQETYADLSEALKGF